MALTTSATQLGCGRDIDQVWDYLDRAPDTHELTCPYCRSARADLTGLDDATDDLRRSDETDPDLQPSPQVLDRILAVARAEVRRGRRIPLDEPTADRTSPNTVSEQAVTAVVRRVGDRTAHVQIRRCAITTVPATGTERGSSAPGARDAAATPPEGVLSARPASVAVSLRVSVAHNLSIVVASHQLRTAVIAAVSQEVGINVTKVDITIEDLHDA